ncbi:hypothetical protein FKM82_000758 [Ascaphus truei]
MPGHDQAGHLATWDAGRISQSQTSLGGTAVTLRNTPMQAHTGTPSHTKDLLATARARGGERPGDCGFGWMYLRNGAVWLEEVMLVLLLPLCVSWARRMEGAPRLESLTNMAGKREGGEREIHHPLQ